MTDASHRIRFRHHLIVWMVFCVVVLACTWPMIRSITRAVPSYPTLYLTELNRSPESGDPGMMEWDMDIGIAVWVYSWNIHQVLNHPGRLFQSNIYYPYSNTLALIDNYFGLAVLGLPVQLLAASPALTYNTILILAFSFTALAVYLLMLRMTGSLHAALFAGLLTAALPYHYAHLHTIHKSMFLSYPLALLLMNGYATKARIRYVAGLAAVIVFQIASTWYLTVGLGVLLSTYGTYLGLRRYRNLIRWRTLRDMALLLLLVLPPLVAFAAPYVSMNLQFPQFERQVIHQPRLPPDAYLTVPENNLLYAGLLNGLLPQKAPLKALFPGFILYSAALAGLIAYLSDRTIRRRDPCGTGWYLLTMGPVSVVLSWGPFLHTDHGDIRLPFYWVFHSVPVFKALRGPGDFAIIAYLAMLFFAGWGFYWIFHRRPNRVRTAALMLLGIAVMGETARTPFQRVHLPDRSDAAQCYTYAQSLPENSVVTTFYPVSGTGAGGEPLVAPKVKYERLKHMAMYYSIFHFKRIPEGHSAYSPPMTRIYGRMTRDFPSPESIRFLQSLGVTHILLDMNRKEAAPMDRVLQQMDDLPVLDRVFTGSQSAVYELAAPGTPELPVVLTVGLVGRQLRVTAENPGCMRILETPEKHRITLTIAAPSPDSAPIHSEIQLPEIFPSGGIQSRIIPLNFSVASAREILPNITAEAVFPVKIEAAGENGLTRGDEMIRLAPPNRKTTEPGG